MHLQPLLDVGRPFHRARVEHERGRDRVAPSAEQRDSHARVAVPSPLLVPNEKTQVAGSELEDGRLRGEKRGVGVFINAIEKVIIIRSIGVETLCDRIAIGLELERQARVNIESSRLVDIQLLVIVTVIVTFKALVCGDSEHGWEHAVLRHIAAIGRLDGSEDDPLAAEASGSRGSRGAEGVFLDHRERGLQGRTVVGHSSSDGALQHHLRVSVYCLIRAIHALARERAFLCNGRTSLRRSQRELALLQVTRVLNQVVTRHSVSSKRVARCAICGMLSLMFYPNQRIKSQNDFK